METPVPGERESLPGNSHAIGKAQPLSGVPQGRSGPERLTHASPLLPPASARLVEWQSDWGVEAILSEQELPSSSGMHGRGYIVRSSDFPQPVRLEAWFKSANTADPERVRASVANHVLVRPRDGENIEALALRLSRAGLSMETDPFLMPWYRVGVPEPTSVGGQSQVMEVLSAYPNEITAIEPDWIVRLDADRFPNETTLITGQMWGLHNIGRWEQERRDADIDAPAAWDQQVWAQNVVVAVCDTGILTGHEDLQANLWINPREIAGDGIDNDENGVVDDVHGFDAPGNSGTISDLQGHGTHVAGIIGARGDNGVGIVGVAWNVQLMSCRWIGTGEFGAMSDAVKAIRYAVLNGANLINTSWGGYEYSQALEEVVEEAGRAGLVMVAAAGNEAIDTDAYPHYPSSLPFSHVVSVGASNSRDDPAWFTNSGSGSVDLFAPGEGIISTYNRGNQDYRLLSGSSMATAFVTGTLALLKERHPTDSPELLVNRLRRSVDALSGQESLSITGGRLNAAQALSSAFSAPWNDLWQRAYSFDIGRSAWKGSNLGAGSESPMDIGVSHSIWFQYEVGRTGLFRLRGSAERDDTDWTLYRGTPEGNGAAWKQWTGGSVEAFFEAIPDETLYLRVAGKGAPTRHISLEWIQLPPGDNIEQAVTIEGSAFVVEGSNRAATPQTGEFAHGGSDAGRSIWWRWTAPKNGNFVLSTEGSRFDTVLAVYRGEGTLQSSRLIASNDDGDDNTVTSSLSFNVAGNFTYWIVVDSYDYGDVIDRPTGYIRLAGHYGDDLVILSQPLDQSVSIGQRAVFQVGASTTTAVGFQWFHNGQPIPGATDGVFVIPHVTGADAGDYQVVLRSPQTTLTSRTARLSIKSAPPEILWQTTDVAALAGESVTLAVEAVGTEPLTYQWFKDSTRIPGEAGARLNIGPASEAVEGVYSCLVSNAYGSDSSASIPVIIIEQPWDQWRPRNSAIGPDDLLDAVVLEDRILVLGNRGIHMTTDGESWLNKAVPSLHAARAMAYDGERFIIAGWGSSLVHSTNGSDWQTSPAPWEAVGVLEHGGGVFLALDGNGQLYRSTTGINWQAVADLSLYASQLVHGNGVWMTVDFDKNFFRSVDGGQTWESVYPNIEQNSRGEPLIGFDGNEFRVMSLTQEGILDSRSSDGLSWNTGGFPCQVPVDLNGATFKKEGPFSIIAKEGYFLYSRDEFDWRFRNIAAHPYDLQKLTFLATGAGKLVIGGEAGLISIADKPEDLLFESPEIPAERFDGVSFLNGEFIVATEDSSGDGTIVRSGDGIQWDASTRNSSNPWFQFARDLSTDGTVYMGINDSQIYRGFDPLQLNPFDLPVGRGWPLEVAYGNGQWVVLGPDAMALSPDAMDWTFHAKAEGFHPAELHFVTDRFFAVSSSLIWSSPDGQSWQRGNFPSGISPYIVDLTVFNNQYVAVGQRGELLKSGDGVNWVVAGTLPYLPNVRGLATGNGYCLLLDGERVWFSQDLSTWYPSLIPSSGTLYDMAWGQNTLIVVGENGAIYQAGTGSNLVPQVRFTYPSSNATVPLGASLELQVQAFDQDGEIDRVEFFRNGRAMGTDREAPYTHADSPVSGGEEPQTITAIAYDSTGSFSKASVTLTPTLGALPLLATDATRFDSGSLVTFQGAYYAISEGVIFHSPDGKSWDSLASPIRGRRFSRMAAREDLLIISSEGGLAISRDGRVWIGIPAETAEISPTHVVAGGQWLMGKQGEDYIAYSRDGLTWKTARPTSAYSLETVLPGGDTMLALYQHGQFGHLFASLDGEDWTQVEMDPYDYVHDILHAEGIFVMLVSDRLDRSSASFEIWTSEDGFAWDVQGIGPKCEGLTYAGGLFFAGSYLPSSTSGDLLELVSDDGRNWRLPESAVRPDINSIAWNGERFLAIGDFNRMFTSVTGLSWELLQGEWTPPGRGSSVASNGETFVTLPIGSPTGWSENGIDWNLVEEEGFGDPQDIEFFKGEVYVCGSTGVVRATADWRTWRTVGGGEFAGNTLVGLATDGETLVVVGQRGSFFTTRDGQTWNRPTGIDLSRIDEVTDATFTGDRLMVTEIEFVHHSTDGVSWTTSPFLGNDGPRHIAGKPGTYVGVSQNGEDLLVSRDGQVWEPVDKTWELTGGLDNITHANGAFVVSQASGLGLVSSDGYAWTQVDIGSGERILDVVGASSGFVAMGLDGGLYQSVDALSWKPLGRQTFAFSIAGLNGDVYLMGNGSIGAFSGTDLGVSDVKLVGGTVSVGSSVTVTARVSNSGDNAVDLGALHLRWSSSTDGRSGNSDDVPLGLLEAPHVTLPPGEEILVTHQLFIPSELSEGNHYIIVEIDPGNTLRERNKLNNLAVSGERFLDLSAWNLSLVTAGSGRVLQSQSGQRFADGSTVFLVPKTGKGQRFTGWTGEDLGGLSSVTASLNSDTSITARFSPVYRLRLKTLGGGSVRNVPGGTFYDPGSQVTLQAVPESGWAFSHWEGDVDGGSSTVDVSMTTDRMARAVFKQGYSDWAGEVFKESQTLLTGPQDDPDGDAYPNAVERLMGGDPNFPERTLLHLIESNAQTTRLWYWLNTSVASAAQWQYSFDLVNWLDTDLVERTLSESAGYEAREVTLVHWFKIYYRLVMRE